MSAERRPQQQVADEIKDFFKQIMETPREQHQASFLLPEFAQRFGISMRDLQVLLNWASELVIRPETIDSQEWVTLLTQPQSEKVRVVVDQMNLMAAAKEEPRLAFYACQHLMMLIKGKNEGLDTRRMLAENQPSETLLAYPEYQVYWQGLVQGAADQDIDFIKLAQAAANLFQRCGEGQQQELNQRGFSPLEGFR